jgi:glucokinase
MSEFLCIEIGGTKLQIFRGNEDGLIDKPWKADAKREGGGRAIAQQILDGIATLRSEAAKPSAIAVGFGGPVDHACGLIVKSHQIEGWENFPLRDWLSKETGLPVVVENDSNLAAYAEAVTGAGKGFDPVFYFNLGSGVGGGLVINGRIYHGIPPGEVEFGHLLLDRAGTVVESRCSGWAIDRRIRESANADPNSVLALLLPETPGKESSFLPAALAQRDAIALKILRELSDDLAVALSHVVHLFHPACMVLGGGLANVGEPLRAAIEETLPGFVMKAFHPPPPLRLTKHGEDAVPMGALLLASTL